MENERLQQLIRWLNEQIAHTNLVINESHQTNNYGRESQYEGMRDAFVIKQKTTFRFWASRRPFAAISTADMFSVTLKLSESVGRHY